jgi:hypothetical protein
MTIPEDGVNNMPVREPIGQIENLFTYHAPTEEQKGAYSIIREKAMEFANIIHDNCPESPDRTAAIRHLRETVMIANASIATGGGFYR